MEDAHGINLKDGAQRTDGGDAYPCVMETFAERHRSEAERHAERQIEGQEHDRMRRRLVSGTGRWPWTTPPAQVWDVAEVKPITPPLAIE